MTESHHTLRCAIFTTAGSCLPSENMFREANEGHDATYCTTFKYFSVESYKEICFRFLLSICDMDIQCNIQ